MNKQTYFDFIQAKLEQSLEVLNENNEENWVNHIEMDSNGKPYLGEVWNKFKMKLVTLKESMKIHFDKLMTSIQAGLPEIAEEIKEEDESDYNF